MVWDDGIIFGLPILKSLKVAEKDLQQNRTGLLTATSQNSSPSSGRRKYNCWFCECTTLIASESLDVKELQWKVQV